MVESYHFWPIEIQYVAYQTAIQMMITIIILKAFKAYFKKCEINRTNLAWQREVIYAIWSIKVTG